MNDGWKTAFLLFCVVSIIGAFYISIILMFAVLLYNILVGDSSLIWVIVPIAIMGVLIAINMKILERMKDG